MNRFAILIATLGLWTIAESPAMSAMLHGQGVTNYATVTNPFELA